MYPAPDAVSRREARPVRRSVVRVVHNVAGSPGFGSGAAGRRRRRRRRGDLDLRERLAVSVPIELAQGSLLLQPGLFFWCCCGCFEICRADSSREEGTGGLATATGWAFRAVKDPRDSPPGYLALTSWLQTLTCTSKCCLGTHHSSRILKNTGNLRICTSSTLRFFLRTYRNRQFVLVLWAFFHLGICPYRLYGVGLSMPLGKKPCKGMLKIEGK